MPWRAVPENLREAPEARSWATSSQALCQTRVTWVPRTGGLRGPRAGPGWYGRVLEGARMSEQQKPEQQKSDEWVHRSELTRTLDDLTVRVGTVSAASAMTVALPVALDALAGGR